jgi:hypothetical protein
VASDRVNIVAGLLRGCRLRARNSQQTCNGVAALLRLRNTCKQGLDVLRLCSLILLRTAAAFDTEIQPRGLPPLLAMRETADGQRIGEPCQMVLPSSIVDRPPEVFPEQPHRPTGPSWVPPQPTVGSPAVTHLRGFL